MKQRCFIRDWVRGEGNFWYGLSIYIYRQLTYFTPDIQDMRHFGLNCSTTTIEIRLLIEKGPIY
jgi:hypothetical protein